MEKETYRKIQKLIILAGVVLAIILNIRDVVSYGFSFIGVFTPFITGICIAFVLDIPMQKIEKFLQKRMKKSRGISILVTICVFILVMILISYMIVPEILNSISEVKNGLPRVFDALEKLSQDKSNYK